MDGDRRSTAQRSTPMLAPPPPARTSGREVFLAVAIGVVFVAGTTMALVGFPSLGASSETRTASVAESARRDVFAPSVQIPATHSATPVREVAAPAHMPKAVVEKPKSTPSATNTSSAAEYLPSAKATDVAVAPIVGPPAPDTSVTERSARASAIAAPAGAGQVVTITGCLEMTVDEDQFRLTDTEGADAPKARSWKSGFLKKGSAPVDLVEFSDAPMLRTYVGHRVVAAGLLTGRQLHVRSVQAGATSCD